MTVDDCIICAFVHKHADAVGEMFFKEMTDCIERIGELSDQGSMPDAVNAPRMSLNRTWRERSAAANLHSFMRNLY